MLMHMHMSGLRRGLVAGVTIEGSPLCRDEDYDWWCERCTGDDYPYYDEFLDAVDLVDKVVDFDRLKREDFIKATAVRVRYNSRKDCMFSDSHGSRGRKRHRPGRKGERRTLAVMQVHLWP